MTDYSLTRGWAAFIKISEVLALKAQWKSLGIGCQWRYFMPCYRILLYPFFTIELPRMALSQRPYLGCHLLKPYFELSVLEGTGRRLVHAVIADGFHSHEGDYLADAFSVLTKVLDGARGIKCADTAKKLGCLPFKRISPLSLTGDFTERCYSTLPELHSLLKTRSFKRSILMAFKKFSISRTIKASN